MKVRIAGNNPSHRVSIRSADPKEVKLKHVNINSTTIQGSNTLAGLTDVDSTDIDEGETVIWDATAQKFVVKPIDGGTF